MLTSALRAVAFITRLDAMKSGSVDTWSREASGTTPRAPAGGTRCHEKRGAVTSTPSGAMRCSTASDATARPSAAASDEGG